MLEACFQCLQKYSPGRDLRVPSVLYFGNSQGLFSHLLLFSREGHESGFPQQGGKSDRRIRGWGRAPCNRQGQEGSFTAGAAHVHTPPHTHTYTHNIRTQTRRWGDSPREAGAVVMANLCQEGDAPRVGRPLFALETELFII